MEPCFRLRGREGRRWVAERPAGVVRRDNQPTPSIEVGLNQGSRGRIERRVLLQPDPPDDRAAAPEYAQGREAQFRDTPDGPRPTLAVERGGGPRFGLR